MLDYVIFEKPKVVTNAIGSTFITFGTHFTRQYLYMSLFDSIPILVTLGLGDVRNVFYTLNVVMNLYDIETGKQISK